MGGILCLEGRFNNVGAGQFITLIIFVMMPNPETIPSETHILCML